MGLKRRRISTSGSHGANKLESDKEHGAEAWMQPGACLFTVNEECRDGGLEHVGM